MNRKKLIEKIVNLLHDASFTDLLAVYNALYQLTKEKDDERKNNCNDRGYKRRIVIDLHL